MKSPKDMAIIEIELTNACIHKCSNCTRFCGYSKKPFFMNFDIFKKAVDSMEGFKGTISLMGGEPTLHPEFEKFANYINQHINNKETNYFSKNFIYPQKNFMEARGLQNTVNTSLFHTSNGAYKAAVNGVGMFSALPNSFLKLYETIQDNVQFQGLNDHTKTMYHQPILISRKSLGISDEKWIKLRNNCWVNQKWSASITPKGAFFCEIAGALDMLLDGPGGWPIEKGWWMREEKDFGNQLEWCEICGLALQTFSRDANDEVDDVSEDLYHYIKNLRGKKVNVLKINNGNLDLIQSDKILEYHGDHYSEQYTDRFTKEKSSLYPKGFNIIKVKSEDKFGSILRNALEKYDDNYIVLCFGNREFTLKEQSKWKEYVINPGTLHISYESEKNGIILLHRYANSLKKIGLNEIEKFNNPNDLLKVWDKNKIINFDTALDYVNLIPKIDKKYKYVIYGTGNNGELIIKEFLNQGVQIVAIVDSNSEKQDSFIEGIKIRNPQYLVTQKQNYDKIFIASTDYYSDIREKLKEYNIEDSIIYNNKGRFWGDNYIFE